MIYRDAEVGAMTLQCNSPGCGQLLDHDFDMDDPSQFQAMAGRARRMGWAVENDGGEWTHTCPDCRTPAVTLASTKALFAKPRYDPDIEDLL